MIGTESFSLANATENKTNKADDYEMFKSKNFIFRTVSSDDSGSTRIKQKLKYK